MGRPSWDGKSNAASLVDLPIDVWGSNECPAAAVRVKRWCARHGINRALLNDAGDEVVGAMADGTRFSGKH
jgi:hypothetical protein